MVKSPAQGAVTLTWSRRCLPVWARVAAMVKSRSRSVLGSQRRASVLVKASMPIHAIRSFASCPIRSQIRFWAKPCRGRLVRPVSLAMRIRSSQRARRRWRSSRSASCPRVVLVTKAVPCLSRCSETAGVSGCVVVDGAREQMDR